MANTKIRDMTSGSPMKHIISFALPVIVGLLFQQFYNMVDTMVVGRWLGVDALAGVGSTGSIHFLIIGFCLGLSTGFAIPISQRFGAKDIPSLKKYVSNTVYMTLVIILPLTVLVGIFCKPILVLMQTEADIIDHAYNYISIIFYGLPIVFAYNLLSAIIRAIGDSRTPLYFLIFAAVLNIILDILSVVVLGMGVEGPAIATVISQTLSVLLCLRYILKKFDILKPERADWKFDKQKSLNLLRLGVPMGLQFSITAIGAVILQTAVNGLGKAYVAAMSTGIKVSMFFNCPLDGLGATMATYVGQNTGAKNIPRIKKGVGCTVLLNAIYSAFAFILLFFVGKYISVLFVDSSETMVISLIEQFLFYNSAGYVLLSFIFTFRSAIQGMGYSTVAMFAGLFELLARSLIAFCFVPVHGFIAACVANPLSWLFGSLFLIPVFFITLKRLSKKIEMQ